MDHQEVTRNRMKSPMIMFAGGGTGGHLYPGIALTEAWCELYPESCPVFVGCGRKIEKEILAGTPYSHEVVPIESPRNIIRHPLRFYRNWRKSKQLAREYISRYQPHVIIGLGGFASYPVVREASRLKIPVLLIEQNVIPGRATSYLSRRANCVCVTYDKSHQYFPKHRNIKTTGNPVRKEILQIAQAAFDSHQVKPPISPKPVLLIQGGSQGSDRINQAVLHYLQENSESLKSWEVRHQTGGSSDAKIISQLKTYYQQAGIKADVRPYYPSPTDLYDTVSHVICRAGGTTLAELHTLQLPAIIIPISNSIRNHQLANALEHAKHNISAVVNENTDSFQHNFDTELSNLLNKENPKSHKASKLNKEQIAGKQATSKVIQEIQFLLNGAVSELLY
ncbi:MAG: glycosyltransferase [Planctomycetaceae bacterium]|nr:glycosyltransferase [Planctomycetaceae bacterium]